MTGERRMFRYLIPIDDKPHEVKLCGNPVAVDAARNVAGVVEFWAEHTEGAPQTARAFQVFFTGQPLPADAEWRGTCSRTPLGLVWHLYERHTAALVNGGPCLGDGGHVHEADPF